MTITFDLAYFLWPASIADFETSYAEVARAGVRCVTLSSSSGNLNMASPAASSSIRAILRRHGLEAPACHGIYGPGYELNEDGADQRPLMLRTHLNLLERAAELGSRTYVCHLGYTPKNSTSDIGRRLVLDALDRLVPRAESLGLIIALENGLPGYLLTVPELLAFVTDLNSPAVGICYDSGHAHITVGASRALDLLVPHVVTVHLHDNPGDLDKHLIPGQGTIDWPDLLPRLLNCPRLLHIETEAVNSVTWQWSPVEVPVREVFATYRSLLASSGIAVRPRPS